MIPSPTQPPLLPPPGMEPEQKKAGVSPYQRRKRAGEGPAALFVKGIFRPIFKLLYYILRAFRTHVLVSLIMILLIVGSAIAANYAVTGQWPFGVGSDPFNFHVKGGNGGGDAVRNWMYALRDGNITALELLDKDMGSPPSAATLQQYISQFSQAQAHLTWKTINVAGVFPEGDSTVDSSIEVDLSANGPGGSVSGYMVWHFVSVSQGGGILIGVDLVNFRAALG